MYRFLHPPPMAVLLVPLSYLPFHWAEYVWVVGMGLASWCLALSAGWVYRTLSGRWDGTCVWLMVLVALNPVTFRAVRVGNISPLVAMFVGLAIWGLLRSKPRVGGLSMMAAGLGKGVSLVLVPFAVLRGQWRMLVWLAGSSMVVLGGSMLVTGLEPWRVFMERIVPTLGRTVLGRAA